MVVYSQVTEFGQIFEMAILIYPTITSLPVSTRNILETLTTLRGTIFVVCFLSGYVGTAVFSIFLLMLLQTYCAIFTSPSSSEAFEEETEDGPSRKKQKVTSQKKATKSNVATLLRMEGKVTPRSIAYAAVLVCEEFFLFQFPPFH